MQQKLYIKTYGCQMNVYDSEIMQEMLESHGFVATDSMTDADVVILNTCHIREKATEKVYSELGRINESSKPKGSKTTIVVAGCVAQAEGEEIFKRAPYVDIIVGPESYQTLPDLLGKVKRGQKNLANLEFANNDKFDQIIAKRKLRGVSSFLTIQEGCDKFCTFCVVPYTRGSEFSRSVKSVLDEAKKLVDHGAKEITLLGQNVNAYHGVDEDNSKEEASLAKLIKKIATLSGLERIRYTTSHPQDMTQELIDLHGQEPKLMPYLHLPIQSGSNRILQRMNRKHTRQSYVKTLESVRKARPDIVFSSDFIVGFPEETEEDFEQTLELIQQVRYDVQCFSFKYSPRPGTPAATKPQVAEEIKAARLDKLQSLLLKQQYAFNDSLVGKSLDVLFDKPSKRNSNQITGRSQFLQIVLCDAPEAKQAALYGKIKKVTITQSNNNSLVGTISDN